MPANTRKKPRVLKQEDDERGTVPPPPPAKQPTPLVTTEVDVNELFARLKSFNDEVMLERLKVLEKSLALIYKEQTAQRAVLKEIQQSLVNLSVTQEEMLSSFFDSVGGVIGDEEDGHPGDMQSMHSEEVIVHEIEQTMSLEEGRKKWN